MPFASAATMTGCGGRLKDDGALTA